MLFVPAALAVAGASCAADRLTVTVTHNLDQPRPSETITIPWTEVNRVLPGALLQHIEVKDAAGRVLPYQVTNVAPQAKDPKNVGIAYGDLIFQHNFAAGEKKATFTVEKIEAMAPPFPSKVSSPVPPSSKSAPDPPINVSSPPSPNSSARGSAPKVSSSVI